MPDEPIQFLAAYRFGSDGRGVPLANDDIPRWTPDQGAIWIHIDVADETCRQWLRNESGLPETIVDTLLAEETRPRSMVSADGLLIVLRGVNMNPGEDPEDMVSIRIWIDANRVISTRRRRLLSIVDIHEAVKAGHGPRNPGEFLASLVERIADRIGDFVDRIDDSLDSAENELDNNYTAAYRTKLGVLRRQIASVRRFLAPQRDALDRLNRQSVPFIDDAIADSLRQEADRITRNLEDLDLARERAIVLQEELLSEIAQQQNTRMYVLSIVAAVFLPLSFLTGLLGMNVGGLPGVDNPSGFVISAIVMVICGVALLAYFRWNKWL